MKATIEIPDDLYRQVKARSALEGRSIREVTVELYERWLTEGSPPSREAPEDWLRGWLELADQAAAGAPPGPPAREILEEDRHRLERRR